MKTEDKNEDKTKYKIEDESKGRTYSLFNHPLLQAHATIEDDRIKAWAKGPMSAVPGVKSALEMIDGQLPALAGENLCISTWMPPAPSRAFQRLAESQVKSIFGKRTPDQVTISITEQCPNKCIHCALPDSGQGLRLEPDTVIDIISQILDLGTTLVIFDGGEPTTYPELPELVESVDSRAISTLFTSGAGFSESLARRLKDAGLYAVNVSLDSPVPEEHDSIRGRFGVFQDALNAIEYAKQAGILVNLYVVLRHENMRYLERFHHLAKMMGAHELTFFEVVPVGRWSGKTNVELSSTDQAALDRLVSQAGPPKIFSVPAARRRFGCFAGRTWMHVTPAGEVYPCACMPQSFGNIFQEPVAEIWQKMGSLPFKGSKTCPMRRS
jgi:MoaA/NifB/PqqE/SkfB family radical SAM enzyme